MFVYQNEEENKNKTTAATKNEMSKTFFLGRRPLACQSAPTWHNDAQLNLYSQGPSHEEHKSNLYWVKEINNLDKM